jgi:hypothetical protein
MWVHYPPPKGSPYTYPQEERPPLGSKFSPDLAAKSGFAKQLKGEDITNLQRVSQDYETKKQRSELVKELKVAVYTGKKPSPVVRALASLNFPLIVTTNYDQLFEKALRDKGTTLSYDSTETLIKVLKPAIIDSAIQKADELRIRKLRVQETILIQEFSDHQTKGKLISP